MMSCDASQSEAVLTNSAEPGSAYHDPASDGEEPPGKKTSCREVERNR